LFVGGAVVIVLRNNLVEQTATAIRDQKAGKRSPSTGIPVELFDGKEFKQLTLEDREEMVRSKEYLYSCKLDSCEARLKNEQSLKVYMTLDLQFNSPALRTEIMERKRDLRVLAELLLSSKTIDEVEISSIRAETMTSFNSLLTRGALQDIRFIDFRIERSPKSR
jgi:hypothetical protein